MTEDNSPATVREAVGVFFSEAAMQNAIDELLSSGFNRSDLSLLASEETVQNVLGGRYEKVRDVEDDPAVPRAAYVSPESIADAKGAVIGSLMYVGAGLLMGPAAAAGGTLAAMISAAVLGGGAGGIVGGFLASLIGQQHAAHIEEQLRHGGLVLWVRTWDAGHEKTAIDILSRSSGKDVHVHEFQ